MKYRTITGDTAAARKALEYIRKYVRKNAPQLSCEIIVDEGYPSLLITAAPQQRLFTCLMLGHIDVVPANEEEFLPRVVGDRLLGRGAADMKGAIAAMINALIFAYHQHESIDSIGLLITSDEEDSGQHGAAYAVENLGITAESVFVPDSETNWVMTTEQKGMMEVQCQCSGKEAHGAEPWCGENAILPLTRFIQEFHDKFIRDFGTPSKSENWIPTLNIGRFAGGTCTNQVPCQAEVLLDIRFPTLDQQTQIEQLLAAVGEHNPAVEVTVTCVGAPVQVDPTNPYLKKLQSALESHNQQYTMGREHGTSDARFFAQQAACLMILPSAGNVHAPDEWISISELEKFTEIVTTYLGLIIEEQTREK